MDLVEITFNPYSSGDVYQVTAKAEVLEYSREEDGSETVQYELYDVEVERHDGSVAELDEEELEAVLTKHDHNRIEVYILEEVRYSL